MAKNIHISEDEQLEKVKKWWKDNGSGIIAGVVLGLCLMVGYNWWQKHQQNQALEASQVFSQLLAANEAGDTDKVTELGQQLKNDYSGHDYAAKGLILSAVAQLGAGETEAAKADLQWVIDHSGTEDNKLLATFKLARQLYREGSYDQALALVQVEQKGGFASQFYELMGDIEFKQGNLQQAQQAYMQAMESMLPEARGSGYREILQLKIDNSAL